MQNNGKAEIKLNNSLTKYKNNNTCMSIKKIPQYMVPLVFQLFLI